jgi:hypothetical protein
MARGKRYQPEQVVNLLRQIEVAIANGKTTARACKEAEIRGADVFPLHTNLHSLTIRHSSSDSFHQNRNHYGSEANGSTLPILDKYSPCPLHSVKLPACPENLRTTV